jgi:hypothetical protein
MTAATKKRKATPSGSQRYENGDDEALDLAGTMIGTMEATGDLNNVVLVFKPSQYTFSIGTRHALHAKMSQS